MTVRINLHTDKDTNIKLKTDAVNMVEKNVIEIVKVNGIALTPDEQKAVNVEVPTAVTDLSDADNYALKTDLPESLSDLTNDNSTVTDPNYVHTDNNFTDALLTKLNDIDDSADANIVEHIKVNGTDLVPDSNKAVNVEVPTAVTDLSDADNYALVANLGTAAEAYTESTLTNGSNLPTGAAVKTFVEGKGYQTAGDVNDILTTGQYATQSYVTTAIGNANHLQVTEVATLPATGETNILYLVPDDSGKSNKDMYIWDTTNSQFVLIGNTEVDLTGYTTESQFSVATSAQIQALFSSAA